MNPNSHSREKGRLMVKPAVIAMVMKWFHSQ